MRSLLLCLTVLCLIGQSHLVAAAAQENSCPVGIERALDDAKLTPLKGKNFRSLGPGCSEVETVDYQGTQAKIINVFYGRFEGGIDGDDLIVPALALPDNKVYILPKQFLNTWNLTSYLTHELETPFDDGYNWSNIQLKVFSSKVLIQKQNTYCIEYTLKFPFSGKAQQCANPEALSNQQLDPYSVSGEVAYEKNAFRWKEAFVKLLGECPKYQGAQCKCCMEEKWKREVPTAYWGNGSTSLAIKIKYEPRPEVEYYVFNERVYRGQEENILVQVFSNGNVRSRPIGDKVYKSSELLEMVENGSAR